MDSKEQLEITDSKFVSPSKKSGDEFPHESTEVKTKGFLLRHIEDQSDGNYTSGSGNAFGILAYTLDAEF